MRKLIAAAIVAASASTGACGQMHEENAGPMVSRNYPVGNFQEIDVAGPYDVNVRTGAAPSVSVQGPQKIVENVVVEVRGNSLTIEPAHHGFFSFSFGSHGKTVFTVTVPQVRAATMAGSGDLNIDKVQGDQFEGKMAGSGDLGVGSLNVQSLKLAMAGAGDTKIGSGQAQNAEYKIVGSGDIDAPGVNTQQLTVSIAGSGNIRAHATGAADVSIMGSGDVDVSGGAKCSVTKHGSGDVRCS
jgi:hypothetical protein